jgi:nucleoside-diphosphate-sugar epimerase
MRVLITGGTGNVGRAATARLVEHGLDVRVIGRREGMSIPGAEYASCDILDYDALRGHVRGCDAVVHLAAIPTPMHAPARGVYRANALGTFHVFDAAEAEGVRRVVQASSINAFGGVFGCTDVRVQYLPVDEVHPTHPTEAYAFSKNAVEAIGAYFAERSPISSVALRLPGVRTHDRPHHSRFREHLLRTREALNELASIPEPARRERIAAILQAVSEFRKLHPGDHRPDGDRPKAHDYAQDPLFHIYNGTRLDFCSGVDDRDSAQAIEKSLTADFEGAHVLYVTDCRNIFDYHAETLAQLLFPNVPERTKPLEGSASLINIDRARALIGFEPEYPITAVLDEPEGTQP